MSQYLLAVHNDADGPDYSPEEAERAFAQVDSLNSELRSAGAWVFAGGLQPPDHAAVVRGSGEGAVTTDGPYLESKEHLGGFWILDVADLDAALAWAERASAACLQPVEVQPFSAFSDVPPATEEGSRPEFLLSVHVGPGASSRPAPTDEELQRSWRQMQELEAELQSSGAWMFSGRLGGPDTATVVTATDDRPIVTDGPFAESKEHLAGFYVIAADDRDEALEWGRRVTACVHEPIEVRPFQVEPDEA